MPKKTKQKKYRKKKTKIKTTPSAIVGMIFGLLLIAGGLYIAIARGEYTGHATVGLGLCLMILIAVVSRGRNR